MICKPIIILILIKSIFDHFLIPGPNGVISTQGGWDSLSNQVSWYTGYGLIIEVKRLINPLVLIKTMGSIGLVVVMILGVKFSILLSPLKKTISELFYGVIVNHFKSTHSGILSSKKNKKGSLAFTHQIYNYLAYLFMCLVLINLGGMVHGVWSATTWFTGTIGLSLIIWVLTLVLRVYNYICLAVKDLAPVDSTLILSLFLPTGTPLWLAPLMVPIEILSYIIRPLSMGLRIAGNIVAGHVILGILEVSFIGLGEIGQNLSGSISFAGFLGVEIALVILTNLELAVAVIQGYVLTLLTSTFLKEVEELH